MVFAWCTCLLAAAAAMQAQLCTILDGTSSPASESLLEVEVEEGDAFEMKLSGRVVERPTSPLRPQAVNRARVEGCRGRPSGTPHENVGTAAPRVVSTPVLFSPLPRATSLRGGSKSEGAPRARPQWVHTLRSSLYL